MNVERPTRRELWRILAGVVGAGAAMPRVLEALPVGPDVLTVAMLDETARLAQALGMKPFVYKGEVYWVMFC